MSITTSAKLILADVGRAEVPERYWELVERYRGMLINQALAILGRLEDAEDVVQETFCEAFRAPHRMREARSVGACLRMINQANALNRRRNRERDSRKTERSRREAPHRMVTTGGFSLLEMRDALAKNIEKLPARTRSVVVLRAYEQMGFEEIAQRLKLSTSTVWKLYYEGCEDLYRVLRPHYEMTGPADEEAATPTDLQRQSTH
jgi:RNA polymerase sigma-70 factor (ECF subfamily)